MKLRFFSTFLVLVALTTWAAEVTVPTSIAHAEPDSRHAGQYPLQKQQQEEVQDRPLTFVALGDSYSAGPGAGSHISWWDLFNTCRRSDHSYPAVVDSNSQLNQGQTHVFDFRSCTGARIEDVLRKEDGGKSGSQLEYASKKADITTLSIGGNNIGFFELLDSCIYHFGGWGSTNNCMEAINSTVSIIKGLEFDMALDLVIKGALDNAIGANSPKLFVTGYAQFFNAETTQCNNVTFCIWENPTKNHTCPLLTQDLRRDMNDLTNLLNAKVSAAIQRAISSNHLSNATITFIDYDPSFEGHRFCEPSNIEPAYTNPDIWFYQTWGDAGEEIIQTNLLTIHHMKTSIQTPVSTRRRHLVTGVAWLFATWPERRGITQS